MNFQNEKNIIPTFFEKHFLQIASEVVIVHFDRNVSDGSPDKVVLDRLV